MAKRRASKESLAEPETKKAHTEEAEQNQEDSVAVKDTAAEEAPEETVKVEPKEEPVNEEPAETADQTTAEKSEGQPEEEKVKEEAGENVEEATEPSEKEDEANVTEDNKTSQSALRLIVPASLGDALEDLEKGPLSSDFQATITVSEKVRGSPDRILSIEATVEAVAHIASKAAEYIHNANLGRHKSDTTPTAPTTGKRGRAKKEPAQNAQQEKADEAKSYSIRVLVPDHIATSKLKKLPGDAKEDGITSIAQESKAKLELSRSQLPGSTERSLVISGSLSELQSAGKLVYDVLKDEDDTSALFPSIPYVPRVITGIYGHPETFQRQMLNQTLAATNPYLVPTTDLSAGPMQGVEPAVAQQAATTAAAPVSSAGAEDVIHMNSQGGMQQAQMQAQAGLPGSQITQQIYIPNDMVGAIIGKGGTKINEIRQSSGSMIRINETPEDANGATGPTGTGGSERMVTITGTPESNKMALYLLYQRIESERHHHKK